jgi:hypothetical protein
MLSRALVFVLALIAAGCSGLALGAGDSEICVGELTSSEAAAVREAVSEWNETVGTTMTAHEECVGGPKSWRVVRRTGKRLMGSERPGYSENLLALYYETFVTHDDARVTALHELGHILGLRHLGPNTVMAPDRNDVLHLTDDDVDAYWTVLGRARPADGEPAAVPVPLR